ncbi:MAG: beta-N-acetylhexosaminidase [Chloroflexi bacterium]|nr:beta-N-acetylhexosaminidase [Chloroflexota bacterium]
MMPLEEKVGQMMMVGFTGTSPPAHILDWLARGRVGGIYLFAHNIENPAQVKQLVEECRSAAKHPILFGIDQEGGIVARLRAGFSESPGAMALGASGDPQLAEDVAFMLGTELAALGINWIFAPVADIAHQPANPSVGARSVGSDPRLVSQMVAAQIRGYQRAGVAATVKHFPGLGNTIIDTHDDLATVSGPLDYFYEKDIPPFRDAMRADVACVMLTHVQYDALDAKLPATLSPRIVTDLLRGELGYTGAVCTDCMEMKAMTRGFGAGESAVLAVQAGVDMPLFSHTRRRQEAAYDAVLAAVRSGRIPPARIDESLARINEIKRRFRLASPPALEVVDCDAHRALAKRAARAGTVLVERGTALPLGADSGRVACIEFAARRISDAVGASSRGRFSTLLLDRLPRAQCHTIDPRLPQVAASPRRRQLTSGADTVVLLTRNAHLQPAQLRLAQRVIDRSARAILVCARNPYDAGALRGADTVICTNGDSEPSLAAAVDALCGDYVPTGQLTVDIT